MKSGQTGNVVPSDRTRNNVHKLKQKTSHLNMRKNLFVEGGRVLGQAAQGGCGVFLSGDIPNPAGHIPV